MDDAIAASFLGERRPASSPPMSSIAARMRRAASGSRPRSSSSISFAADANAASISRYTFETRSYSSSPFACADMSEW